MNTALWAAIAITNKRRILGDEAAYNGGFEDRGTNGGAISNVPTISASRAANVATLVTALAHGLVTGNVVSISGLTDTSFNATNVTVLRIDDYTIRYDSTGSDVDPSEKILNPGFEISGAGGADVVSFWLENVGDGSILLTTAEGQYHSGSKAIKLVHQYGSTYISTPNYTVVPGQEYLLTFWTRGDGAYQGRYDVYDVTHSTYIKNTTTTGNITATWSQVSYTFTIPAGCTSMFVRLLSPSSNGGPAAYFDDVSLTQVVASAASGRITTDPFQWWAKTPDDGMLMQTAVDTEFYAGTNAAKLTGGVIDPSDCRLTQDFAIIAGAEYELSLWCRGDGTHGGSIELYDRSNGEDIVARMDTNLSTTWERVTVAFTAPAGCVSVRLLLYAPANGSAYFDEVSFRPVTYN